MTDRKKEAIARLGQYRAAQCALENLRREELRLRSALEDPGVSRPDRTPGAGESREDRQVRQLLQLQQTQQRLEQTRGWLEVTGAALESLPPEERLVLQRLFIAPRKCAVPALCRELNTERSSVYRRREQALRNFTTALYGPQ